MPRETPNAKNIVLIDIVTLRQAEKLINACAECNPECAEIPFDWVLDRITGYESTQTHYLMEGPARCPRCKRRIFEKTLVEPRTD